MMAAEMPNDADRHIAQLEAQLAAAEDDAEFYKQKTIDARSGALIGMVIVGLSCAAMGALVASLIWNWIDRCAV